MKPKKEIIDHGRRTLKIHGRRTLVGHGRRTSKIHGRRTLVGHGRRTSKIHGRRTSVYHNMIGLTFPKSVGIYMNTKPMTINAKIGPVTRTKL